MIPLSEATIRSSFINASRKEVSVITLPAEFSALDWDRLDFLGWRDPKINNRAYVVVPHLDGDVVGILLRRADARPRTRAQCSWCKDVTLPNDVVLYSAKRSRGRGGTGFNTVDTLLCEDFECSRNVRRVLPLAYEGYDREAARQRRIDDLQLCAASFATEI